MDQAAKLREMLKEKDEPILEVEEDLLEETSIEEEDVEMAKVITISSGKGGVGKTNFAVNFSIAIKNKGFRVALIDADIGLGNVEIVSGVVPNTSLSDIIYSDKDILDILTTGPNGIKIVSGGSGLKELTLMDEENFKILLKELKKLQESFDYIIIDTGAGISNQVLDFILPSDELIVVGTPDPTSIMDSYVLLKSVTMKGYNNNINIVPNMVKDRKEANEVFNKLNNASRNFLKVQINYLGYIEKDDMVSSAIKSQNPFIMSHPDSMISKRLDIMANNFINKNEQKDLENANNFVEKLFKIFKMR